MLAAAAYANLSWRSIGPAVAGGRVAAVAGTPQDDQLYYLGTAGGGVWKSANGGATWQPVFEKQGGRGDRRGRDRSDATRKSSGPAPARRIRATT